MKCLNSSCKYYLSDSCTNSNVVIGISKCDEIEIEMDCLACNLNENNKCADCCKDWNEDIED
ncbi:hypothetical protein [Clostridium neonatale]|uniref:hypothetical protein n=1 Tax=Clostridium neonatale TaxID=137838 RepID=UPI00291B876E|nr:conserved hypothetical protein [Clostridium neonatale]